MAMVSGQVTPHQIGCYTANATLYPSVFFFFFFFIILVLTMIGLLNGQFIQHGDLYQRVASLSYSPTMNTKSATNLSRDTEGISGPQLQYGLPEEDDELSSHDTASSINTVSIQLHNHMGGPLSLTPSTRSHTV